MDKMFTTERLASGNELERLRCENAELRRRVDALSPIVRNLALNPLADQQGLRNTAWRALRSVQ